MMEFGVNPYDDWEGYEAEREKLLTFLKNSVKNVAIVSTDFHSNWVNDARIKTWPEDGGPINSGVQEFISTSGLSWNTALSSNRALGGFGPTLVGNTDPNTSPCTAPTASATSARTT